MGILGTWGSYRCFTAWNESLNKTFSMTAGSTHEDGVIKTMVPMVQGWMNIFEKDGLTL